MTSPLNAFGTAKILPPKKRKSMTEETNPASLFSATAQTSEAPLKKQKLLHKKLDQNKLNVYCNPKQLDDSSLYFAVQILDTAELLNQKNLNLLIRQNHFILKRKMLFNLVHNSVISQVIFNEIMNINDVLTLNKINFIINKILYNKNTDISFRYSAVTRLLKIDFKNARFIEKVKKYENDKSIIYDMYFILEFLDDIEIEEIKNEIIKFYQTEIDNDDLIKFASIIHKENKYNKILIFELLELCNKIGIINKITMVYIINSPNTVQEVLKRLEILRVKIDGNIFINCMENSALLLSNNMNNLLLDSNVIEIEERYRFLEYLFNFGPKLKEYFISMCYLMKNRLDLNKENYFELIKFMTDLNKEVFNLSTSASIDFTYLMWYIYSKIPVNYNFNKFITTLKKIIMRDVSFDSKIKAIKKYYEIIILQNKRLTDDRQSTHTSSINISALSSAENLFKTYQSKLNRNIHRKIYHSFLELPAGHIKIEAAKRFVRNLFKLHHGERQKEYLKLYKLFITCCMAVDDTEKLLCKKSEALDKLMTGMYEIQRGYNLDEFFNDDGGPVDKPICVDGSFNKLVECLTGVHPDCQLIILTEGQASMKFNIVVQEEAKKYLSEIESTLTLENKSSLLMKFKNSDLNETSVIWNEIKEIVINRIMEEFGELYDNNTENLKFQELMNAHTFVDIDDAISILKIADDDMTI